MSFAKIDDVRVGTKLQSDDALTCLNMNAIHIVECDENGLFIICHDGRHYLDGQIDGDEYIGLTLVS